MVHHTCPEDMARTNGHPTLLNTSSNNNNNNSNNMSHHLDGGEVGKLWIFGYGSLVWNPGFQYTNFMVGHVKGYKRRFWQGNTVHRGSPEKPGRVVTVVQDEQSETWGLAFQVTNASSALYYLDNRESHLGGYRTSMTTFHPKDSTTGEPFQVLMYVGGHDVNTKDDTADGADGVGDMYLGPAPLEVVADQVVSARGSCGHNVEYVLRLAHFMRAFAPHVRDDHLFKLEHLVLGRLKDDQSDLSALMPPPTTVPTHPRQPNNLAGCRVNTQNTHVSVSQSAPKKKHGCLNM